MRKDYENGLKILQKTNVIYQMKTKSDQKMSLLWVHMVIPFLITSVLLLSFAVDGVLIGTPECCSKYLSFVRDTSCSICLILFFVMSYFLAGSYPAWTNESFELNKTEETIGNYKETNQNKQSNMWKPLLLVVVMVLGIFLLAFLVLYCVKTASGIPGMWTFDLSGRSRAFYAIYMALMVALGVYLLIYSSLCCYKFNQIIRAIRATNVAYSANLQKEKRRIEIIGKCVGIAISYITIYILGTVVIIYNDYKNYEKYGIQLGLQKNPKLAVIILLLAIAVFIYFIIPVIEYMNKVKEIQLYAEEHVCDPQKLKIIESIDISVFASTTSRIMLLFSVVGPIMGVVSDLLK